MQKNFNELNEFSWTNHVMPEKYQIDMVHPSLNTQAIS